MKQSLGKCGRVAAFCALAAACASTSRAPSDQEVIRAYRLYESGRCDEMTRRVMQIDWATQDPKRKPFFDVMRAFCLELEGDTAQAVDIYETVVVAAPQTHQAYEAILRLQDIRRQRSESTTAEAPSTETASHEDPPVPVHRVDPIYPSALRAANIEGWVQIELDVAPDGNVTDVMVVDSQPRFIFDGAALAAARHWIYEPRLEQSPVRTRAVIKFVAQERGRWSSKPSTQNE